MHEPIRVVTASSVECRDLCSMIERYHYAATPLHSLSELNGNLREGNGQKVVILDLDGLPVDNRYLRDLSRQVPDLCLIGFSGRTFHPELQEAMSNYISACLVKPVDSEELIYWLKSVCFKEPSSRDSPDGVPRR